MGKKNNHKPSTVEDMEVHKPSNFLLKFNGETSTKRAAEAPKYYVSSKRNNNFYD